MKYKLLVLDLDGTLTNKQKKITPHTKETLLKIQEQGVKIVLASGRPTYGIAPLAEQLELQKYEGYILAYNGGEIIDWKTKELMYKNLLDHDVLPYLYECAKKNDFAIVTYDGEYVLTEKPDDEYVLKEALLNVMKIKKVDNFLDAVKHPIAKCLIVGEPTRLAELEKEMYEHLKDRMGVFRSEPYFLELVPKGIDKAQSLAVLLKEIGLTREEMIAIGDGFNDLSMIQYAGLSIAMANAAIGIKCIGVDSDDLPGYTEAKDRLETHDPVYALVPLTFEPSILSMFKLHAEQMSQPERGMWRIALGCTRLVIGCLRA